jgi:hypothetical protein
MILYRTFNYFSLFAMQLNLFYAILFYFVDYGIPLSQIKIVLFILANRECLIRRRRCINILFIFAGQWKARVISYLRNPTENFPKVTCAILAPNSGTESEILSRHLREYDKFYKDSSDGMICTYYKKFPNIAGPSSFISGNKSYRIDGIRSLCHIGTKFWDWVWDIE